MKYILGIDIGTTNTKAVAFDLQGRPVAQANSTYPFISTHEGYHELDPRILFVAVTEVMKAVLEITASEQLAGISFSSAMHGLIAVDEKGHPLTNMITWADLRSTEYAMRLKYSDLGHRLYERTGAPVHPMLPLCKLMWMKDHQPEIFKSAHKFISIKEYVFPAPAPASSRKLWRLSMHPIICLRASSAARSAGLLSSSDIRASVCRGGTLREHWLTRRRSLFC